MIPRLAPLRAGRVHEAQGPARTGFAAIAARRAGGRALWVCARGGEALHPLGLLPFLDPSLLLIALPKDQTDALAVAEEALKDGSLACVILEITRPLDLREGRRLQLAASAGASTGLCLIPEGMGSNAAETRWHASPLFGEDSTLMRLESIKNKSGTIGAWNVCWNPQTADLDLVAAPCE